MPLNLYIQKPPGLKMIARRHNQNLGVLKSYFKVGFERRLGSGGGVGSGALNLGPLYSRKIPNPVDIDPIFGWFNHINIFLYDPGTHTGTLHKQL